MMARISPLRSSLKSETFITSLLPLPTFYRTFRRVRSERTLRRTLSIWKKSTCTTTRRLNMMRLYSACISPFSPHVLSSLGPLSNIGRDRYFEPNQSAVYVPYVKELLDSATGKDKDGNPLLTPADLSRISSKRRAESKAENPEYTLNELHRVFGSQKYFSKY